MWIFLSVLLMFSLMDLVYARGLGVDNKCNNFLQPELELFRNRIEETYRMIPNLTMQLALNGCPNLCGNSGINQSLLSSCSSLSKIKGGQLKKENMKKLYTKSAIMKSLSEAIVFGYNQSSHETKNLILNARKRIESDTSYLEKTKKGYGKACNIDSVQPTVVPFDAKSLFIQNKQNCNVYVALNRLLSDVIFIYQMFIADIHQHYVV